MPVAAAKSLQADLLCVSDAQLEWYALRPGCLCEPRRAILALRAEPLSTHVQSGSGVPTWAFI
jgi:hypothetical protein